MFPRYRQKTFSARTIVAALAIAAAFTMVLSWFRSSERREAKQVVETFYHYEQAGDFGSSWELFHPLMKKKFPKDVYIQRRAHVFMPDFGAKTFEYRIDDIESLPPSSVESKKEANGSSFEPATLSGFPHTLMYHAQKPISLSSEKRSDMGCTNISSNAGKRSPPSPATTAHLLRRSFAPMV